MTPEEASEPAEKPKTPPSTAGMTTKVVKGSLWTLAGQVAPLAVSLVATPFVIRLLGAESYGVLILIGLIPTYLGFADFGMSMASTKFGSEAYAEGDEEKEARIVRTAALIALMTSVPVAAALMIFASPVIALFNVPEALQAEAATALRIAAVTFVINFLCGIFNTPQLARLRMDLNTFINAGSRILGLIATPIVLYLGYGIIGAVTVLLAASLLNLLGHLMLFNRIIGRYFFSPKLFDWTAASRLTRFGRGLVVAAFAAMIVANSEKAILPAYVDVAALAYYSVAFTLASMTTLFSQAMIQSLIPAFSRLQSEDNREQLRVLFFRGLKFNLLLLFPVFFVLYFLADSFFSVWAGSDFGRESSGPFYVLQVGLLFNIPAYLPYALLMAEGRSDIFSKLYVAEMVPYVLFVIVLTANFGIMGAAAAWSIRIIVDGILLFILAGRVAKIGPPGPELWNSLVPASVLVFGIAFGALFQLDLFWESIMLVLVMPAYIFLVFRFALDSAEMEFLAARCNQLQLMLGISR